MNAPAPAIEAEVQYRQEQCRKDWEREFTAWGVVVCLTVAVLCGLWLIAKSLGG